MKISGNGIQVRVIGVRKLRQYRRMMLACSTIPWQCTGCNAGGTGGPWCPHALSLVYRQFQQAGRERAGVAGESAGAAS